MEAMERVAVDPVMVTKVATKEIAQVVTVVVGTMAEAAMAVTVDAERETAGTLTLEVGTVKHFSVLVTVTA